MVSGQLVEAAMIVLKGVKADENIEFLIMDAGSDGGRSNSYFPKETWEAILRSNAVYKAPTTTILAQILLRACR